MKLYYILLFWCKKSCLEGTYQIVDLLGLCKLFFFSLGYSLFGGGKHNLNAEEYSIINFKKIKELLLFNFGFGRL